MTDNLCGEDENKWDEALVSIKEALAKRINLWDGVFNEIVSIKKLQYS
jgi:hypothetical protein